MGINRFRLSIWSAPGSERISHDHPQDAELISMVGVPVGACTMSEPRELSSHR
jgi:hypothetical protein